MRALAGLPLIAVLAGAALADEIDLTGLGTRVDEQAATTTGKTRATYVKLQKALGKPNRPGLVDDFARLRAAAAASEGRLSADATLAAEVTTALFAGQVALGSLSDDLVQLTAALESEKDRKRCGAATSKGRKLADRATTARITGHETSCAKLAGGAASAYQAGMALATKLLAKQDARAPAWSVPLHDLGGALLALWIEPGPTPAVYAVGADDGSGPTFLRMGAEGWVDVPIAASGDLWWVNGVGDAVFASGTGGRVVRYDPATGGVTDLSIGVDVILWGIWGSSTSDVWTVGGNVDGVPPRSALYHHDGNGWTSVALPAAANNRTLFKIWGKAANDVWVCGQAGLLLHYDGAEWTVVPSGTFESLFTVHGDATTISVGGGAIPTIVEKLPTGFAEVALPAGSNLMRGVFVPRQGDAWASGLTGTVLRRTAGQWQRVSGLPAATGRDFHAVYVDDSGGAYFAGGDLVGGLGKGSLFYFGPRTLPTVVLPQAKLRADVHPHFTASCVATACHTGVFPVDGLDLTTATSSWSTLVGIQSHWSPLLRVLPGRPSQSFLWHKIAGTQATVGTGTRMPQFTPTITQFLTPAEMDLVRAWILEGARDN